MPKFEFIQENSNSYKLKFLFSFIFIILVSIFFAFAFFQPQINDPIDLGQKTFSAIKIILTNTTPMGLFLGHLIGGIFFVTSADELIFYYGLANGSPILISICAALGGYLIAQTINYFLGAKIGSLITPLISKKKMYGGRRFVNKYGAYGIFFFNILPLPAPLLTFTLGIAKYNFKRLFIISLLAKIIEYSLITAIFLILHQ